MSSPSSDRDIPESKASSSRKKSRDKRTLCACQRCRSLKKKVRPAPNESCIARAILISTSQCKPQEGRTSARCTRCEATGEVCRYYSVSNDPRLQNGSSNDQDTSSPSVRWITLVDICFHLIRWPLFVVVEPKAGPKALDRDTSLS